MCQAMLITGFPFRLSIIHQYASSIMFEFRSMSEFGIAPLTLSISHSNTHTPEYYEGR
jgi:hypothetical protein